MPALHPIGVECPAGPRPLASRGEPAIHPCHSATHARGALPGVKAWSGGPRTEPSSVGQRPGGAAGQLPGRQAGLPHAARVSPRSGEVGPLRVTGIFTPSGGWSRPRHEVDWYPTASGGMDPMARFQDTLRRLAMIDEGFVEGQARLGSTRHKHRLWIPRSLRCCTWRCVWRSGHRRCAWNGALAGRWWQARVRTRSPMCCSRSPR
jgi:hypothetical protein